MSKEMLLNVAQRMPADFQLDDLVERLLLLEKIDAAQKSLDAGKGVAHEDAVKQIRTAMKNLKDGGSNLVS